MTGHRSEAVLLDPLAFRATQVRSKYYARALLKRVFDRREAGSDARVVLNLAVLDRHVEVNANESAFTFQIEVFNGELFHGRVLMPLPADYADYTDKKSPTAKNPLRTAILLLLNAFLIHC